MFGFTFEEIFQLLIFLLSLIAIVITFGIVWRVERQLDISYKFILAAIITFSFGELIEILRIFNVLYIGIWWQGIVKGLFAIFFIIGVSQMWRLIKDLEVQEIIKKTQRKRNQKT